MPSGNATTRACPVGVRQRSRRKRIICERTIRSWTRQSSYPLKREPTETSRAAMILVWSTVSRAFFGPRRPRRLLPLPPRPLDCVFAFMALGRSFGGPFVAARDLLEGDGSETVIFRMTVAAFWALVIGLTCVYLEYSQIRIGYRIHRCLKEADAAHERLRRLEMKYNRLVGADVLERFADEFIREEALELDL